MQDEKHHRNLRKLDSLHILDNMASERDLAIVLLGIRVFRLRTGKCGLSVCRPQVSNTPNNHFGNTNWCCLLQDWGPSEPLLRPSRFPSVQLP